MARPARYSRCVCCGGEFKRRAQNAGLYCSHKCAVTDQTRADGRREIKTVSAEWRASRGCAVCGITILPLLDAHHVDPSTKRKNTKDIRTLAELEYELAQCICLCKNHHKLYEYEATRRGRGMDSQQIVALLRRAYPETMAPR